MKLREPNVERMKTSSTHGGFLRQKCCFAFGATLPALPNSCTPVTLVEQSEGGRGGIATGSIFMGDTGSSRPTLVYQYTYDACAGPGGYFESATCPIDITDSSPGGIVDK
jgi:hypothetical protein